MRGGGHAGQERGIGVRPCAIKAGRALRRAVGEPPRKTCFVSSMHTPPFREVPPRDLGSGVKKGGRIK